MPFHKSPPTLAGDHIGEDTSGTPLAYKADEDNMAGFCQQTRRSEFWQMGNGDDDDGVVTVVATDFPISHLAYPNYSQCG
jgi:hypothetical protein